MPSDIEFWSPSWEEEGEFGFEPVNAKYKSAEERKDVEVYGELYESIEAEYFALVELYENDPEHFVRPIMATYDQEGEMKGYYMEAHIDRTLSDVYSRRDLDSVDIEKVAGDVYEALERMEGADLVHGDLGGGNILVTEDSSIKIIDPLGFRESAEFSKRDVRIEDWESVNEYMYDIQLLTGLDILKDRKSKQS